MKKRLILCLLLIFGFVAKKSFAQQTQTETKEKESHARFGFTTGYSAILGSANYQDKFPVHGFILGMEIGEIFKERFEFGAYFGFNLNHKKQKTLISSTIGAGNFEYLMNISIMPYMRYYFMGTTKTLQPYLGAGVGFAYNLSSKIQNSLQNAGAGILPVINWSNALVNYSNFSVVTRATLGLRMFKYLDAAFTYAYLGWINRNFYATGPLVDVLGGNLFQDEYNKEGGNVYKNRYHLHALELKLQLSLDVFLKEVVKK